MKTLVLLSVLVPIALAAPAQQEDVFRRTSRAQDRYFQVRPRTFDLVRREKKSPTELSINTVVPTSGVNIDTHTNVGVSSPTARSFALKKPVIVKKKHGYRLYRDSEEEKAAESHETCGRQVKVKLCDEDGKFQEMLRSSAHEISNIHSSEDEMKHSIMMAKEAVENLQRDLKNIETRNSAMKMAHDSETDTGLHEDIEVARQALEHIHQNFENLETTNSFATSSRSSEAAHDLPLTVTKSEEERMAQWKEAIENIQKNLEIARNIEDSFKTADNEEHELNLNQFESVSSQSGDKLEPSVAAVAPHVALDEEHHMREAETTGLDAQLAKKENGDEHIIGKITGEHARENQNIEEDMNPAASETVEMKAVDINNPHTLRSENHELHEHHYHHDHFGHGGHHRHHQHFGHHDHHEHAHFHEKSAEDKLDQGVTNGQKKVMENSENIEESHPLARSQLSSEVELAAAAPTESNKQSNTFFMRAESDVKTPHNLDRATEDMADIDMAPSMTSFKTVPSNVLSEHRRNTEMTASGEKSEHLLNNENTLRVSNKLEKQLAKSAELIDSDKNGKIHEEAQFNMEKSAEIQKSAEKLEPESKSHFETFDMEPKDTSVTSFKEAEDKENKEVNKSIPEIHGTQFDSVVEQNENVMRTARPSDASAVHSLQEPHHQKIDYNESDHTATLTEMKSAEDNLELHPTEMKSADDHLGHHLNVMKAAEDHLNVLEPIPTNRHLPSLKAEDDLKSDFHGIDHMRSSHLDEPHFMPKTMGVSHDFELPEHGHHHGHVSGRYHNNLMTLNNVHDMSGMASAIPQSSHTNMREAIEDLGSEPMFRWKPSHEFARSAYGSISSNANDQRYGLSSSIGASGGAVGVFPNANTGGCGIPLLLSCSPSVVSGSLAKAHAAGPASYSAPSYRSEDEFAFHNKRDVKLTNEALKTNVLRSSSIMKQKSGDRA